MDNLVKGGTRDFNFSWKETTFDLLLLLNEVLKDQAGMDIALAELALDG